MYDFANILFAGPCTARCPFCIGWQIDPRLSVNNLDEFPPRNLDRFVEMIWEHAIPQVVFTGTTTDPQLYRHEVRLIDRLRKCLPAGTQISLHTNGRLALKQIDVLNQYDRVCVSFPTFDLLTYEKMMGVRGVPDLATLLDRAQIPVKISSVITADNHAQLPHFLARCHALGIRRMVLRHLYGDDHYWPLPDQLQRRGTYRSQPIYDYYGLEVTVWRFEASISTSINLFSDGTISESYLLAEAKKVTSNA